MRCEKVRKIILEQTLEGPFAPSADLEDHLWGCPECHDLFVRVAEVDMALRALPLEQMPAWSVHQMLARAAAASRRQAPCLPWTLWLPIGSLLIGLLWSYITLIWPNGPDVLRFLDPTVAVWLTQFEDWVVAQQTMLNAVALSVGVGFLFTALAVVLGFYVGRSRRTPRERHSH